MLRALEHAAPDKTQFHYKVRKLVDLVYALAQMAGQESPAKATREAFIRRREEFDTLWAEVAGEQGVPEGLIEFLGNAYQAEGAPLNALSAPIRGWLEEHSVLDALRVQIR
jgi:hypothetical protein